MAIVINSISVAVSQCIQKTKKLKRRQICFKYLNSFFLYIGRYLVLREVWSREIFERANDSLKDFGAPEGGIGG